MADAHPHTSAVRLANARDCAVVLREADGALTLAELAGATGLSRRTVESVLSELRASGIAAPAPVASSGGAERPARRFGYEPASGAVAALDIDARSVRCLLTDAAGRVLARSAAPTTGADPLPPLLRALSEAGEAAGIAPSAGGVGGPALVDPAARVVRSLAVAALEGLDPGAALADRVDLAVEVETDTKLAALSEHHLAPPALSIVLLQLGHRVSVAV